MRTKIMALGFTALVTPGLAQTPEPAAFTIEEIIVTAQKREQRLIDVPLSVTAVTAEQLAARGVTDLRAMQYAIPGLSLLEYGPGGVGYTQLRGISSSVGNQTVGKYLDEMPVIFDAQGASLDIRMLDMERIEVLRGPQATLYGEGSMGGTIRYITATPDLTTVSGAAEAEIATVRNGGENYKINGVINLPLVEDKLGIRLVAGYQKDGGWIDNLTLGEKDANDADIVTLRGKVLWKPTDAASLTVLYIHQETDQDNQNFGVGRRTVAPVGTPADDRYDLVTATLEYDFDTVELVNSIGYIDRKTKTQNDFTPFYLPVLEATFALPPGFITEVPGPTVADNEVFANELRLASSTDGPLHWTIGGNYRWAEYRSLLDVETAPGTLPFAILTTDYYKKSESWGAFVEVGYDISDRLNALVGLRYYRDSQTFRSLSESFGFPALDLGEDTFKSWNPRFNLSYAFSQNSTAYANVSKGFRSGGFNATSAGGGVFTIPPTFDPDSVWTYEVGTKHQLFDRKLDFEASVYYSDWKNVQSSNFAPGSAITITTNGGKVQGWGTDISLAARPVEGLTLSATYGWNNLEFKVDTADKLVGDPVDFAVRESWSASLDYRRPVYDDVIGFFRADYQHAGKSQITLRSFGGQVVNIASRDLVNLRAGLDFGRVVVSLFAENLFDEDAPVIPGPFGVIAENVEQYPRTLGINGKVRF